MVATRGWLDVWTSLSPVAYLRRSVPTLPFPLHEPAHRLFGRTRHAVYAGVHALGLRPGDQVLVPAYHHGAEVEALLRAGLDCVFYGATPDLEPDAQELERLVGPGCRALYLTHVLGFPRDADRWRRWCDEQGLLLVEDATQAWLASAAGRPVGTHGALSIFGLSAVLPLPRLSAALSPPWTNGDHGPRDLDLRRLVAPYLLSRLVGADPAPARRENFRLLLEQLGDLVPAPFDQVPDGASPFAFPVEVSDKAAVGRRLAARGVRGLDFWPAPHPSLPSGPAATAATRRQRTLVLPVHQQLTTSDLDRVAAAVRPPTPRGEMLHAERVHDLDALRDEWSTLALRTRNIFATWEWHRTWWDHFGRGRRLVVTALRDGRGALRAVLPLYLWAERPLRVARFVGHTAGDQLGPICAPGDEPAVSRAVRALLRRAEWDLLVGEQLPADSAWGKRLSGRIVSREGSPVVRFRGSWEETTSAWSARLRKELRRDERRLRDDHDLQVRTVGGPGDLGADLDTFFGLHRARWTQNTGFEQRERFHRDFAGCALANGWLRLRIAEADGDPAAARLGFRFHGVESGYQSGWDASYARYSLGILLLADTIRSAHSDGMAEYRFLRGGEQYKYRFANADPGLETVILSRAATAGLATAGAAFAGGSIPRYLRAAMAGHG